MPTPSIDPESGLPLIGDAEFERMRDLDPPDFEALPVETREAFDRTSRWHFGQRQQLDVYSIFVDGRPYAEVLKELEAQEKAGPEGQA